MSDYEEQWERVQRWFERIEEKETGTKEGLDLARFRDNYLAFFENCFHLRDHIKNSQSIVSDQHVNNFVKQDKWLSYCADIANGQKHLAFGNLNSHKSGENPKPSDGTDVTIHVPSGESQPSQTIETDSGEMDAYHLAEKCLDSWRSFLKSEGLL